MAFGASFADAFVRLRVDSSLVAKDTEAGLVQGTRKAGASSAGRAAGRTWGTQFSGGAKMALAGLAKAGGLAAGVTAAVFGGQALMAGVKYVANLEQARIGFTTMLGSARKADVFLRQLQAFAAKTPFEFSELVADSERMIAFGFAAKDVIPYLTAIGDAVAGLGGNADMVNRVTYAIGQMQAKTRVQSDELLQLTEAGIPALRILANQYGVSAAKMQEMVTAGVVASDKAIPLLISGLEKGTRGAAGVTQGFANMMARQSTTLTGLWSNFVDIANQRLGQLITPALPAIKRALGGLVNLLTTGGGGGLRAAWALITTGRLPGQKPVNAGRQAALAAAGARAALQAGVQVGPAAPTPAQVAAITLNRQAQQAGVVQAPTGLTAWQRVLVGVHALVVRLVPLVKRDLVPAFLTFWHWVTLAWAGLVRVGQMMLPAWRDVWTFIQQVGVVVRNLWQAFGPFIGPALGLAVGLIVVAFRVLAWILSRVVGPALISMSNTIRTVVGWLVAAAGGVLAAWRAVSAWFGALPGSIAGYFRAAGVWLLGAGRALIAGLYAGTVGRWAGMAGWLAGMGGRIVRFFIGAGVWLYAHGRNLIGGFWSGLSARWAQAAGWLAGMGGRIGGYFRGAASWLWAKGRDVLQGFWNGIMSVWNRLTGWVSGIAGWIKAHKGPVSLDARLLYPAGRALMGGLYDGLIHGWSKVWTLVGGVATKIADAIGLGKGVAVSGTLVNYAKQLLAAYGWAGQWAAFNSLVMGESGWNVHATNPTSGAYGIPQALPASKMASAGADWQNSGFTQLRWMMGYIKSVYGSPAAAWSAWQSRSPHWYARGGWISEPVLGIGRSGQMYGLAENGPEYLAGGDLARLMGILISVVRTLAGDTGQAVAGALNGAAVRAGQAGRYATRPGW